MSPIAVGTLVVAQKWRPLVAPPLCTPAAAAAVVAVAAAAAAVGGALERPGAPS